MSNPRVQLLNERWVPLASATVEAYLLSDFNSIEETQVTDRNGVAEFVRADAVRCGFRAKITRYSGKSGAVSQVGVVHLVLLPEA